MRLSLWAAVGIWGITACDRTEAQAGSADPLATASAAIEASSPRKGEPEPGEGDDRTVTSIEGGEAGASAPLARFMNERAAPALRKRDLDALAATFDAIAAFAPTSPPPTYVNWTSIANDGAAAARAANLGGVLGACRGCHAQYRAEYRRHLRDRPLS